MHYLIDGHNLIGKLPDLDLSDSEDEIRLILRLQKWVAGGKQRQVTAVFDRGALGGVSHRLSTREITVVFAPAGKQADDLLIRRLQRLRNPRQYVLVSSDRRIIRAAQAVRVKTLKSEEFVQQLGFVFQEEEEEPKQKPAAAEPEKEEDPQLSDAEVAEWLQLFGPAPRQKRPSRPRGSYSVLRKQAPQPEAAPEAEPEPKRPLTPAEYAAMAESENPELDEAEVAEWMALFAAKPQPKRPSASQPATPPAKKEEKSSKPRKLTTMKDARRKLTDAEVDEWLQLFGGDE